MIYELANYLFNRVALPLFTTRKPLRTIYILVYTHPFVEHRPCAPFLVAENKIDPWVEMEHSFPSTLLQIDLSLSPHHLEIICPPLYSLHQPCMSASANVQNQSMKTIRHSSMHLYIVLPHMAEGATFLFDVKLG